MTPNLLTIAGSDPSGGAGIQADLKTFSALGGYGMAAITALTAQNTQGVTCIHHVPADFVRLQIQTIFDDIRVDAVKIGMAGSVETVAVIADVLEKNKPPIIVLDPVMIAQSGDALLTDAEILALKEKLLPLATIITPNLPEAEVLLGRKIDEPAGAAQALLAFAPAVLLKGGHADGARSDDILATQDMLITLDAPRIDTKNNHGTGCTLAAALAAYLAQGLSLREAARRAKHYITQALQHSGQLSVGHGHGPVHHFWNRSP